jgi:hypothetical protein
MPKELRMYKLMDIIPDPTSLEEHLNRKKVESFLSRSDVSTPRRFQTKKLRADIKKQALKILKELL